ncbi:alpha/beta hydrolase family protein [Derxia lacustris]|uniref:alpha/beta hydrolase family protein n=1 Tax=Derxia lacustris TaxID=764842 RepID=UPI000A1702CC|nr:CocE/NonD family hydrolase [Derxia lacustris]
MIGLKAWALLAALWLAHSAQAQEAAEPVPEMQRIPVPGAGAFGGDLEMVAQVYRPDGPGPFPVLVFSHGRVGTAFERLHMKQPLPAARVREWLQRGYAVVAPFRPGYGETGGADAESSGARHDADGSCTARPDPSRTALAGRRAMLAAIDWVRAQPWAQADRLLLEGQSAGGLTTVALCAANPPGVVGCINFAGGAGGSPATQGRVCSPELLEALYGEFGRTTRLPNVWLYSANDQYWGEAAPRSWHAAFAAGGSPTTFIALPALPGADGHLAFYRGPRLWRAPLADWLMRNGF